MLQELIDAWYLLGRLGSFDSSSLTVLHASRYDVSHLEYHKEQEDKGVASTPGAMHSMTDLEVQGSWARFWVDLGSADEVAFDMLINALRGLSIDHLGVKTVVIGGVNEDWPVPEKGLAAELTMNPMRVSMPDLDPTFNPYDNDDLERRLHDDFRGR